MNTLQTKTTKTEEKKIIKLFVGCIPGKAQENDLLKILKTKFSTFFSQNQKN